MRKSLKAHLLILFLLLTTGCGGWQKTARVTAFGAHGAVRQTSAIAQPVLRETCKALAEKCKEEGVLTAEACTPSLKCVAVSKTYRDVARAAVLTAAALQVAAEEGNEDAAANLIQKLAQKLAAVRKALGAITNGDWEHGS